MSRPILIAVAAACLLAACSKNEPAAPAAPSAAAPTAPAAVVATAPAAAAQPAAPAAPAAPHPGLAPAPQGGNAAFGTAPAPVPARNTGKVLQMHNGGGYTYAEVETAAGQKVWIAGTQLPIKAGDPVEWGNFAVMRNFEAKSIGRSFPEILFVDRWGPVGNVVATPAHGTYPPPAGLSSGAPARAAAPAAAAGGGNEAGVVKSVTNAGGYSYIEVDRGGRTVWVAAMETPMKKGDKVRWEGGTEMSNFTAKSLGRTFDRIIFAQGVNVTR